MSAHKDRIRAAMAGEPVDRPPVSLWRHNFLREWSAEELADEAVAMQHLYDWDLLKLNPRWSYLAEAFGNRYRRPAGQHYQQLTHRVVETADDLGRIAPAASSHPALAQQLDALRLVVGAVGADVDVIHTVFSPLAVVGLLAGGVGEPLIALGRQHPNGLQLALEAVRETVLTHIQDALDRGASGVFYAPLRWTSQDVCDAEFYAKFGLPHDAWILSRIPDAEIRVLHLCGDEIGEERFRSLSANAISWDDRGSGNPSMPELAHSSGKTVMSGVPHRRLGRVARANLRLAMEESVNGLDRGFILAGGCAVGAELAHDQLAAVANVAGGWRPGRR